MRDLNDPEDTARECFIVALWWPVAELLLILSYPFSLYYGLKYKYDLWRWRVRQNAVTKPSCFTCKKENTCKQFERTDCFYHMFRDWEER